MKSAQVARIGTALLALLAGRAGMADVVDSPTERRLSLATDTPAIVVPREGWVIAKEKRRAAGRGVYYALEDERRQMIFSVFIEKGSACQSADACLETALANPTFEDARDLKKTAEGPFRVAQFYLDQPRSLPVFQAQLLASAFVEGQWFDVRISKLGKERPDPAPLLALLRRLAIK
jgi:hypothetical protein